MNPTDNKVSQLLGQHGPGPPHPRPHRRPGRHGLAVHHGQREAAWSAGHLPHHPPRRRPGRAPPGRRPVTAQHPAHGPDCPTSYDRGYPTHVIQDLAGHADARTTRRYDLARESLDRSPAGDLGAIFAAGTRAARRSMVAPAHTQTGLLFRSGLEREPPSLRSGAAPIRGAELASPGPWAQRMWTGSSPCRSRLRAMKISVLITGVPFQCAATAA
jgi:hypothetical protein